MTTTPAEKAKEKPKKKGLPAALRVVRLAEEHYYLARAQDGAFVAFPRDPRAARVVTEIGALRGPLMRLMLANEKACSAGTMSSALEALRAKAAEAPEERVFLRAAPVGAALHLDLAQRDESAAFVEVSRYGWEIRDPRTENDADAARPLFRRTTATKPLPVPQPNDGEKDARDEFRVLLGLSESDPRWLIVWGWLVAAMFEDVPRPILWAVGPQGSGKSTRARMILSALEPCDALGRPPGDSERDDSTSARGRFLPSWDNIGSIGPKTSDWLCRLVTGVEIDRRALYTDDDVRTTVLRRSGVATSIVLPYGLQPDALERLVLVHYDRVPQGERKPEAELWDKFRALHPRLLGALLDDVAGVLAHRSSAKEDGPLPRMADYAVLLAALDLHHDRDPMEGYADAYRTAVDASLAEKALDDPLVAALLKHVKNNRGEWTGAASALHAALAPHRPDDPRAPWPHKPESLGRALTTASETLRAVGLSAVQTRSGGVRKWTLTRAADAPEAEAPEPELLPRLGSLRPPQALPALGSPDAGDGPDLANALPPDEALAG